MLITSRQLHKTSINGSTIEFPKIVKIYKTPSVRTLLIQISNRQSVQHPGLGSQLVKCLLGILNLEIVCLLVGNEDKVVVDGPVASGDTVLLCNRLVVDLADVDNQRGLDTEDGVRGLVGVAADVERATFSQRCYVRVRSKVSLRDQRIVAGSDDHKVHVAGSVRVPVDLLEHLSDGTIVRDGVRHRPDGLEPKVTVLIRPHDATAVGVRAVRVLGIVVSGLVGLPHVNRRANDRLAGGVLERAAHEAHLALSIGADAVAGGELVGIVRVEGAENGALGRTRGLGVVDVLDEGREAEGVGEENKFLSSQYHRRGETKSHTNLARV